MIDFLIKSSISLFVLLVIYHLALENEKMHQFNRFYLLFAIAFSLTIPLVTIEVIQELATAVTTQATVTPEEATTRIIKDSVDYWTYSIYTFYILITSILLIRFITNILKLRSKAKSTTRIDYKEAQLVLVKEKTLPYTFLNTIFINEMDYHNRKIEDELYTHELIHVTQKHTLDILFIETLKVLFWFNPVFIFYKKAIQLNHEFLADEKVVQSYNNVPFYQNLLLAKANANPTYYLASNLNYSVTKKRLIMMTKTTSVTRAVLKKSMLIPVVTALLFLLCTKVVAQETNVKKEITPAKPGNLIKTYYDKTTFKIKDEKGKVTSEKKYNELTPLEKRAIPSILAKKKELPTNEELLGILSKGAPEVIEIDAYDSKNQFVQKGENEVYNTAGITEKPDFPGGIMEFYKFVSNNFKTPEQPNLKGKVYITFIVEKDGSLSDIKNIRDIGFGTGEEAIRVLKICPKWNPGKMNGVPVRVMYSLPITIQSGKA